MNPENDPQDLKPAQTPPEQNYQPPQPFVSPPPTEPEPGQPAAFNPIVPPVTPVTTQAFTAPQPAVNSVSQPGSVAVKEPTNPGLIVLQWLTYAFWGWTILALSILTTTVFASIITDADTGGFTPYGIAAILVLLPISYVCDTFYSKREPVKKVGAEIWVMVIHAVIFALFGIGALISAVIAGVLLLVNSSDNANAWVWILSGLIVTVYYTLTFLRTLRFSKIVGLTRYYKMIMLVSVGVIALLGLFGPVAKERSTRDDRLISSNLDIVSEKVSAYTRTNNRLPASLNDLGLSSDAKKLIDRNLVTYKKEGLVPITPDPDFGTSYATDTSQIYKYQLCVTYKSESPGYEKYSSYNDYSSSEDDGYSTSPDSYSHPAGNVCYKLKTDY